jgi:steroid delta-isomerase-like uncharacterized protein
MTNEQLIETTKELIGAFCSKDWAAYKSFLAPDSVYVEMATGRTAHGADEIVGTIATWTEAFPDIGVTFESVLSCDNVVVAEITWSGTQTGSLAGPLGTIPPSGNFGTVRAIETLTFEGEKVKEMHHYFDLVTILLNAGALPTKSVAAVA